MGQGGQEWLSDWPAITITGMNQALLLYERLGLEPERLRRLWRSHFVRALEFMPLIGRHRRRPVHAGTTIGARISGAAVATGTSSPPSWPAACTRARG